MMWWCLWTRSLERVPLGRCRREQSVVLVCRRTHCCLQLSRRRCVALLPSKCSNVSLHSSCRSPVGKITNECMSLLMHGSIVVGYIHIQTYIHVSVHMHGSIVLYLSRAHAFYSVTCTWSYCVMHCSTVIILFKNSCLL